MGLIDDIIQGEIVFPRRFASVEERDYGLLYHVAEIPDSHDGNHACILHPRDVTEAVADVRDFYRAKGLTPRVYHLSPPGEGRELREALLAAGFRVTEGTDRFYVHRGPSRIQPTGELTVRRVQSPLPELLEMVGQSDSAREMNVVRLSLRCPDYHLLVGLLGDRPVATASVERAGPVWRVDTVMTHKPSRGKGYCRAVIHELVRYHGHVLGGVLCLYADNPTAVRIYEEAGFEQIDAPLESWSAWQD